MISKSTIDKITQAARIEEVIGRYVTLKKKGKDLQGLCPFHDEKTPSFSVSPAKQMYKCFGCGKGGKSAVSFLMDYKRLTYPEALTSLAEQYNIIIEQEEVIIGGQGTLRQAQGGAAEKIEDGLKPLSSAEAPAKADAPSSPTEVETIPGPQLPRTRVNTESFRNQQLKSSGIDEKYQKTEVYIDENTKKEIDRYQAATINDRFEIIPGDDMVMHYIDLYGRPMTYVKRDKKGNVLSSKVNNLIRVRFQNPHLHLDKDGRPTKYKSPWGSGSHLWIPNFTRGKFERKSKFATLFVDEGEKKADKCTLHGMISVGIMGIHNIAYQNKLPHEFELLIKACEVENVVLFLDSDFNDISQNPDKPADARPRSFLAAVRNFRDYFYAFNNTGIHLNIYFAHVKPNEKGDKGRDDLLANTLRDKEYELEKDINLAMASKDGLGTYVNVYKITGLNEYKLQEYFHLQSTETFVEFHKEKLKKRVVFKIGKLKWRFNDQDKLELAQPLMPNEEFWKEDKMERNGREFTRLNFHYGNCYNFLKNRSFGRFPLVSGKYKFIRVEERIVQEQDPFQIKDFIINFVEQIGKENVLEMLYRGSKMYMGPDSLSHLKFINPGFHKSEKGVQYLYFKKNYWKVTADGIEEKPMADLDGYIWKNKVINFDAKHIGKPMLMINLIDKEFITRQAVSDDQKALMGNFLGKYSIEFTPEAEKCDFLRFLQNTSNFYWRTGIKSPVEMFETNLHFLSKITAIGYLLHRHRDRNVLKAVVGMDGKNSEVGTSNGRSGKSLIGDALGFVVPTVYIPGKRKDLTEDKFIWEEVDERTNIIFLDDVRVNVDFEFFFPIITGKMQIEGKGIKKYTLPQEDTPKLYLTTNHALNGDGGSFADRQALIAFSDYYHRNADGTGHSPVDDFGCLFFDEWDYNQWNLFHNLMAFCLQTYFKLGIVSPPQEKLERRRLRQQIGEALLEWADVYYSNPNNINRDIPKKELMEAFHGEYPDQKKYIGTREFKRKMILFCKYKGYTFNPGLQKEDKAYGGDDKRHGIEFFTIANQDYVKL